MTAELVHSLVYTCKASKPMSEADIQNILKVARQRNPETGITGILFYRGGHFLQLLEGEEAQVHSLLDAIRRDPRQTDLDILDECKHERLFSDWSMDFQLLDPPQTIESVKLPASPLPAEFNHAAIRLRKMLITFINRFEQMAQAPEQKDTEQRPVVHSLVYTCMARSSMSQADIDDILDVSRRNNARRGITGILFYRNNHFLQVLEGDQSTLHQLMDTIRKDPRQTGLAILDEGKHPRIFGDWAMDYKRIDAVGSPDAQESGFVSLPSEMSHAQLRLRKLLVSFMNR